MPKTPKSTRNDTAPAALFRLYHHWRRPRDSIPDRLWRQTLAQARCAQFLPRNDRARLRHLTTRFLQKKTFDGAAGIQVTETMRAGIALRACVPILQLGLEFYAGWNEIVIYPGDFRVHNEYTDDAGVVHREVLELCGESLSQGPMVLSWEAITAGVGATTDHDLVIHECAHKLDILNGAADGFPPLHSDLQARAWTRDFRAAYDHLCAELNAGRAPRLDSYAATDPAEFFAVASEIFFTAPALLCADYPAIYTQLRGFYRQDPVLFTDGGAET